MLLPLNAFLLRPAATPVSALADLTDYTKRFFYWGGQTWAELDWTDADIIAAATPGDIAVVLLSKPRSMPPWQRFIGQALDVRDFGGIGTSYSTAIFCAIPHATDSSTRWVAWCFGTGSRLLSRSTSDPRFGLTIALNLLSVPSLPPGAAGDTRAQRRPQVRQMQYRTTAPYFQQTGHRAGRDIPLDGFRVDRLSDLVAAMGGRTDVASFTNSVLGGRSIKFRSDIEELPDLIDLSVDLLELCASNVYHETFSWIDNIRLVEDEPTIDRLYRQLMDSLMLNPIPPYVDAILPDDLVELDDERAIQFILYPHDRRKGASRINLTVEMVADLALRRGGGLNQKAVLNTELRFLDDAHEVLGRARLIDCLCAEFIVNGGQYIAYDGDFYKVDRSFVERIDTELNELPTSSIHFPPYKGETEPKYTDRIRDDHKRDFVVLDRALIRVEGEAGIEASDLVSESGALIHLKRKGKSSVLSHLFLQAANSCELLRRSPQAQVLLRELVHEKSEYAALTDTICAAHDEMLAGKGLEVVFAFLGNWHGRTITSLPLFSRISLVQESRKVSGLGFYPSVALISTSRDLGSRAT
jgi:uncharacterized protein (TIGR04141 family)